MRKYKAKGARKQWMKLSLRLVHTWEKFARHNLFMCVAWSEANVPSREREWEKTLSTNYRSSVRERGCGMQGQLIKKIIKINAKRETASPAKRLPVFILQTAQSTLFTTCKLCTSNGNNMYEINGIAYIYNAPNKWVTDAKLWRNMMPSETATRDLSRKIQKIFNLIHRLSASRFSFVRSIRTLHTRNSSSTTSSNHFSHAHRLEHFVYVFRIDK